MLKARIAVLVSGGGTNLQALIDAQNRNDLASGEIVAVISSKEDAFALERAGKAGIAAFAVPKKGKTQSEFEEEIKKILVSVDAELIILAGFMCILSAEFTSAYEKRIINIHPSLIPAFCGQGFYGMRVHEAVIDRGVKVTGATVHYVNEIPDGGEIIFQKAVCVAKSDTPLSLQQKVMREAEWKILPRAAESVSKRIIRERNRK